MREIRIEIEENKYALFLKFLKTLDYIRISPLQKAKGQKGNKSNYDFSDLVGKLQWNGDAVLEQRRLRDEWYFCWIRMQ